MSNKLVLKVVGGAAVGIATIVTKKLLDGSWKVATGNEPPTSAEDPDLTWSEALAWAVLSGAVIGVAQLLAARGARQLVQRNE
jgi:Protein of unknown function (DUF4235)